jgi:D-alanyl-D-alanine carboxypeptidase (penicillin-binding protein 5/6)
MTSAVGHPVTRTRTFVIRRVGALFLALGVVSAGIYVPVVLVAPLPAAAVTLTVPEVAAPAAAVLDEPSVGASAISVVGSAENLGSSGATGPVPIASVTKIITTLVVLEAKPLALGEQGPNLTMTATDVGFLAQTQAVGGSYELVNQGQVLSEYQIIEIMLLESANNYSLTLVNWAFGSMANYLEAARAFTAANGLADTTVVDSSGLDAGSVSSTKDLMKIASLAMANPALAQIVGTKSNDVAGLGTIDNTNTLLGFDGIDGIKTGTTDEAGSCLLFSAVFTVGADTITVVGVILGAASSQAARDSVRALLDSAKRGYTTVTLVKTGDVFGQVQTVWGETADLVADGAAGGVVYSNPDVALTAATETFSTGAAGDVVGKADAVIAGTGTTVPLTLDAPLTDPGWWWRLTNPGALFG